jgi:hypothetical protein
MAKKSKKDKKRKARLSDKDIIKLLKKLRPKTQQIVRVNVGDKDGKKAPPAFNPTIVPVTTWAQAPPSAYAPQAPIPPALPPPLPVSQQPQLQPIVFPRKAIPTATAVAESEIETETPVKVRKARNPRRTRDQIRADQEQEQEQELIRAEQRKQREIEERISADQPFYSESRFRERESFKPTNLGSYASESIRYYDPVQNDRFAGSAIPEDLQGDQAGTAPAGLPSDQWSGTPQGEFESQPLAGTESATAAEPAPDDTFSGSRSIGSQSLTERIRSIPTAAVFAEEEPDWAKSVQLADLPPPPPAEEEMTITSGLTGVSGRSFDLPYMNKMINDAPLTATGLMRADISKSIKSGYTGVPQKYLTPTGRLKSKIPNRDLLSIYSNLNIE